MAVLNDYGEATKEKIHLLVTTLCDRNCKHCCNKQYDLNEIPYVTMEELSRAKKVYITGGEPFKYANPVEIAGWIKSKFKNIEVYGHGSGSVRQRRQRLFCRKYCERKEKGVKYERVY